MANEVTVSASLAASKAGVTLQASATKAVDMAGDQMLGSVQIVGTTAEAIALNDVATLGYIFLRNMDATNFVEIALDSAVSTQIFAKLLAGQVALFPAKTATMYAKADTAPVNLHVAAVEL